MKMDDAGYALLEKWEELVLFTYDDAFYPPRPLMPGDRVRGTPTAGYGHTGDDVYAGMTCTEQQADDWLISDTEATVADLLGLITASLSDNQFSALVCLAFDIGTRAFAGSSALHLVNLRDLRYVPAHMELWNKTTINHRLVLSDGLVKRRAAEVVLWNTP